MRNSRRLVLALALLACCSAGTARAADAPWGPLDGWVGQYPTRGEGHAKQRLLDTPAIHAALTRLLTASDYRFVRGLPVERPVAKIDSFVVVQQCQAHACPDQTATIVIDTAMPRLWVALFRRDAARVTTLTAGPDPWDGLPDAIRAGFRSSYLLAP